MPKKIKNSLLSEIETLLMSGKSIREVSTKTGVSKSEVGRLRSKLLPCDTVKDKGGRKKILNEEEEKKIVKLVSKGKLENATSASNFMEMEIGKKISLQTIRRTLKTYGLKSHIKKKKPFLSEVHKKKRFDFAKKYKNWGTKEWRKVIWSDETKINVFSSDGKEYYWKRTDGDMLSHHTKPTVKHGGGKVVIWGCMTYEGIGYISKIEGNMDAKLYQDILSDELFKTIKYYNFEKNEIIFQQDNDPKHTAKSTKKWLQDNNIKTLEWPPQSPDMNPIEHLWVELKRRIKKKRKVFNKGQLWEAIQEEYELIDVEFCRNLINTIPQRIQDLFDAKGGNTKW
jgi:transposase